MAMRDPDEDSPGRALVAALLGMAGVALVVGLAVGLVAAGVLGGVGDGTTTGGDEAGPTLYMPEYQPTESGEEEWPSLPQVDSESPDPAEQPVEEESPKTDKITLFAAPQAVSPGQRINLNGVYIDGEGVALQVQRREGDAWTDFPVQANVRGGVFTTWIQTSRTGTQRFRVADPTTDRVSNVVEIAVG